MDFVRIADFNNTLEAETAAHLLDEPGIPYHIHSDQAVFGEGGISRYVFLSVPADREEEARGILESIRNPPPDA